MPITDFPEQGGDSRVSLQASRFPLFPVAEAQALKDEWPEIWDRGGNILGDTQFNRLAPMARDRRVPETDTEEEAVRLREAWAARHLGDFRLAGVVAQIKWLVIGSRGLDHMRQVIMDEKERLRAKSIMDAPLSIKDGKASFVMTSDALDRQGEVVEMDGWEFGNFMRNPVILDTHRYESIEDIVGRAVGEPRREGSGWVVDIEFAPTERGKTAKELVDRGMLNAVSVGFRSMQRRKVGSAVHHVKKELLEVSLVAIPANPTALRVKAAIPFADLPLAPEDKPWDGAGAEQRVQALAGAKGRDFSEMDWDLYAKAFLWVDPENREQVGGYKLGFADVVDGELVAVPRGLMTAAAVLAGARGGVDIPEADREGVVRVLSRYYDKMDREVPEGAKEVAMMEDDKAGHDKKPRMKNEQMMELRDHLVAAAALVDAMLEGYDEGEEEMPEDEAPMAEESVKTGGAGQESATSANLVEALSAAMAAIKGK
jgi:HK97 family phage prohead protease